MPAWTSAVISDRPGAWLKPVVWVVCAAPLVWLLWAVAAELRDGGSVLGADPGEAVVHHLGEWGLRLLLLALAVSPLRRRLGWPPLGSVRRLIGLFAFAYLLLHALAYLWFLAGFDWRAILEDVVERAYITAGALGLACLIPLAVTSTRGWRVRLGARWSRLHRLVFVAAGLGLVHLWWLSKGGYGAALAYLVIFLVLMAERWLSRRRRNDGPGSRGL
jgi:methionine sulfoxide reductase heme-binding subunit